VFGAQLNTIYGLSYGEILFAVRVVLLAAVLGADCTRLVPLGGRAWPGWRDGRLLLQNDTDTAAQHNTTPHAPKRPLGLSFGNRDICSMLKQFDIFCLSEQ
jgi:hypothetical protein